MCKELDIDLTNVDPNDEELKAVLMAACQDSDSEDPKLKEP